MSEIQRLLQVQSQCERMNDGQHWGYCMVEPVDEPQAKAVAALNQHLVACEGCRWVVCNCEGKPRLVARACEASRQLLKAIGPLDRVRNYRSTPYGLSDEQAAAFLAAQRSMFQDYKGGAA